MRDYDGLLYNAKQAATNFIIKLAAPAPEAALQAEQVIGALNKAWDELTDCLNARIKVRDAQIRSLMNQLAEHED